MITPDNNFIQNACIIRMIDTILHSLYICCQTLVILISGSGLGMAHKRKVLFYHTRDSGLISRLLYNLYAVNIRTFRISLRKLMRLYWGSQYEFYSITLRKIFKNYHGVEIGMYSHGGCFVPNSMPPGVTIGRYCSIALGSGVYLNHPINMLSTHAFFFNPALGYVKDDPMSTTKLIIGNDVWIGQNAIILPGCTRIGDGAIIGAGSVVNKDIPPFAIAIGNPCRVVQYRFSKKIIEDLLSSQWWNKTMDELSPEFASFRNSMANDAVD
jgi:virginiamycin A acetyltransferase